MKKIYKFIFMITGLSLLCSCGNKGDVYMNNDNNGGDPLYVYVGANCYEDGRIFGEDPAMYIDYSTMEKTVLCAKPNCTHNTSECVGKIVGDCPLMYNGYLYYFNTVDGINETGNGERVYYINSKLCRVSMNSSEVEEIAEFTGCKPNYSNGYLVYDNTIYFTGSDMNPTPDDYGNIVTLSVGGIHYLCSINLETGEYTNYGSIYDGDKQYKAASNTSSARIVGCYNSKLYVRYSFCKEPMTDEVFGESDLRDYYTILNFEFDFETNELTGSDLPEPSYLDFDSYIYSDRENGKSIVLDKDQRYELNCDTQYNASFVNNKVFVPYEQKWYDLTDMSEHSMGEYSDFLVVAYVDDCYIFELGNKTVKLTEEEILAL